MVLVPELFVGDVIVIQLSLLTACQEQVAGAFTINEELPLFDMKILLGDKDDAQPPPAGAAACETSKEMPAIVSEPERVTGSVFAATEKLTVPGPGPLPDVTEIHEALLTALQLQPAPVFT
jgi:hypothetical protein